MKKLEPVIEREPRVVSVPPPAPAPTPVKAPEPEPVPQPQPPVAAYTPPPEPVQPIAPEPTPVAPPVAQMADLRVEEVVEQQPPQEEPQPQAQLQMEEPSAYANIEVISRMAAEGEAGQPVASEEPSAYVVEETVLFVAEAIYDYEATAEDELGFHIGDLINVTQKVQ